MEKRPIKCHSCNYEWNTGSDKANVSCPDCLLKTLNISEADDAS